LELFPDVLRRRVDAAGEASDPWRALLQTTTAQPMLPVLGHTPIRLRTFGTAVIEVHGTPARVGLGKAVELAVYLASVDRRGISRDWLAREAFGGGESGQNYLRQTIHRLRRILPQGVELHSAGGQLSWAPVDAATTDDRVFEGLIARARVEVGSRRLGTLREALALVDAGPYLPEFDTAAIASRRRDLDELEAEARTDLARGLIEIGDPAAARDVIRTALRRDPVREDAWQLLMRAEAVLGGPEAVGRVLVECRDALARAGLEPCANTTRTAERLRRVEVAASA
jgi:DNA-binding SARP family transcriptional activator